MNETGIEWTHRPGTVGATWNPVVGCSRVSEGCRHCYAETMAARIANSAAARPEAERTPTQCAYMQAVKWRDGKALPRWSGKAILIPDKLSEPLRRKRPTTYFVNSMSDLFHESLSFEQIAAMFGVMAATPQHTHLILTKRPERAAEWFGWIAEQGEELEVAVGDKPEGVGAAAAACALFAEGTPGREPDAIWPSLRLSGEAFHRPWPLPNVWLGVSAEDQPTADQRIPHLLRCPAAVRFVSYEPALGPADFGAYLERSDAPPDPEAVYGILTTGGQWLDWIIVGGESGPGARPFDLAWARSTVEQCRAAGVRCFVKQLGARPTGWWRPGDGMGEEPLPPTKDGGMCWELRDRKGGDWSEWPEDLHVREWPTP